MKFGRSDHPGRIDFTLPEDDADTEVQLRQNSGPHPPEIYLGCAKWTRQDLQNFYPTGVKDALRYYGTQFNAIELNATFYRFFASSVFIAWREKTPDRFFFFPKLPRIISHDKRLQGTQRLVEEFLTDACYLREKLGMVFLQMIESFGPKNSSNRENLIRFVQSWPREVPLAVELRHTDWFNDPAISREIYMLFEEYGVTNIITDAAARRDLLHMRLTTPYAFIRYVSANHESDYERLDDWVNRIVRWSGQGIRRIAFFIHQSHKLESPLLARYLTQRLNQQLHCNLTVPADLQSFQKSLF